MRPGVTGSILLLVYCLSYPVSAVYADEAYQVDFHHILLGRPQPQTTFLHRPSTSSKASLLYTLSERSVLGAVNPKDGSVIWRQQLDNGCGLLKAFEGDHVLVSAVNGTVQAWDAAEGRLLWDWRGSEEVKALEVSKNDGAGRSIFFITQGPGTKAVIRKVSGDSGAVVWEHVDESGDTPYGLSISQQGLFYVALHSGLLQGSKLKVTPLEASTGVAATSIILHADKDLDDSASILSIGSATTSPLLVWSDRSLRSLHINVLGSSQIHTTKLSGEKGKKIEDLQVQISAQIDTAIDVLVHCYLENAHWAEVYQLDLRLDSLKKLYQLPSTDGPAAFSSAAHSSTIYFIRTTERDVTLFSSVSDRALGQWPLQPRSHNHLTKAQGISHAVSEVVARGTSSFAVRSAVLLSSGDWKLIHNGEELWFRPESLSGVISAAWAEVDGHQSLADELAAESHSNVVAAYVHRIKRHIRELKGFPPWAKDLPDRIIDNLLGREPRAHHLALTRDSFGFHKIVIGATDSGRLFALETGDHGKILWNIQASAIEPGQRWAVEGIETHHDIALIRGRGGEALRVNVTQGQIIEHRPGGAEQSLKTAIDLPDSVGSAVSIEINADGSVRVPRHSKLAPGITIVTQDEKTVIRGWTLVDSNPVLAWTFGLQKKERVVTLAARPSSEPVASIGKALGDRNVLYKFLNPNLLIVGTVTVDTSSAAFYVLDSTSGHVVHSLTHPNVDTGQPVSSVASENWFAYSVFSNITDSEAEVGGGARPTMRGYQLVVSELFESSLPNDRGALGSVANSSSLRPIVLNENDPIDSLYVVSQIYLVPAAVSFMTVTSTLQGITPRSLLCFIPSLNSVVAIPRAFADPRRPVGRDATPAEAEEGLFRHNAVLDYNPKWVLNHMREVLGIQKVITSPSLLESTSLVFAFGTLDMFGTRVTPIGGFDILGKGFNKLQLVGTVAALAVGTGLLAPMVSPTVLRSCRIASKLIN
ncbi:MAG: hypothetical protein Q9201_003145 [Fulgogasparrea decipioides]